MSKQDETLKITADLWNSFLKIPKEEMHPDDTNDIRFHIHAIQNILYTQKYMKLEYKIETPIRSASERDTSPNLITFTKVINETRQISICPKCNSNMIRKYWIYFFGKQFCINKECGYEKN